MLTYQNKSQPLSSLVVDTFKLLFAIFVVGIHVGKIAGVNWPYLIQCLLNIAVPGFFAFSGYYMACRMDCCSLLRASKKYLEIYMKWMLIYSPFAVIYYYKHSLQVEDALKDYIHGIIFIGETPMTWHLWYIHAMILVPLYCLVVKKIMLKNKQIVYTCTLCIAAFILLCIKIQNPDVFEEPTLIYLGLDKYQNSIFCGMPCFCIGALGGGIV